MEISNIEKFKIHIKAIFNSFNMKMEQSRKFQQQEQLSAMMIEKIANLPSNILEAIPEFDVYKSIESELKNSGKNQKDLLSEKLFTDGYRIFEEFIADIFQAIFNFFPYLLLIESKDEIAEISVPFRYIFTTPDIEGCKNLVIEKKVKSYIQGDSITTVLKRFDTTFRLKMTIAEEKKQIAQHMSLMRNLLQHNNGIVNQIYIATAKQYKIVQNYIINDSITLGLLQDINTLRTTFESLATTIIEDLDNEDNLQNLEHRNNDKAKKLE
jgi:hypothetical protein